VRIVQPAEDHVGLDASAASRPLAHPRGGEEDTAAQTQPVVEEVVEGSTPEEDVDWCERALRLQADMENYRKRQQRLAQDQIGSERQRLLRAFLRVVDNLERALEAPVGDGEGLRQGIRLTHDAALKLLENEGVERFQPENQPFDPNWQEAVGTTVGARPDTVAQVLEPGYRLGSQLLRPAKVVVAV
jgi:molecular chaperone GrpE